MEMNILGRGKSECRSLQKKQFSSLKKLAAIKLKDELKELFWFFVCFCNKTGWRT